MEVIIKDISEEECILLKKLFSKEKLYIYNNDNINTKNFLENQLLDFLTKTEIKALDYILKEFNHQEEGDIKVNQVTEKCSISTSVFRTLFYKLKENKIAEIDSRGVKGTHIKFYNYEIIYDIIEKYKKI